MGLIRDDEELAFDIYDAIESIWEKHGIELSAEDGCRAHCRMDLVDMVKRKLDATRPLRKFTKKITNRSS